MRQSDKPLPKKGNKKKNRIFKVLFPFEQKVFEDQFLQTHYSLIISFFHLYVTWNGMASLRSGFGIVRIFKESPYFSDFGRILSGAKKFLLFSLCKIFSVGKRNPNRTF